VQALREAHVEQQGLARVRVRLDEKRAERHVTDDAPEAVREGPA
jgi:hypothetical protein